MKSIQESDHVLVEYTDEKGILRYFSGEYLGLRYNRGPGGLCESLHMLIRSKTEGRRVFPIDMIKTLSVEEA